jgi:hypothetical protein
MGKFCQRAALWEIFSKSGGEGALLIVKHVHVNRAQCSLTVFKCVEVRMCSWS